LSCEPRAGTAKVANPQADYKKFITLFEGWQPSRNSLAASSSQLPLVDMWKILFVQVYVLAEIDGR